MGNSHLPIASSHWSQFPEMAEPRSGGSELSFHSSAPSRKPDSRIKHDTVNFFDPLRSPEQAELEISRSRGVSRWVPLQLLPGGTRGLCCRGLGHRVHATVPSDISVLRVRVCTWSLSPEASFLNPEPERDPKPNTEPFPAALEPGIPKKDLGSPLSPTPLPPSAQHLLIQSCSHEGGSGKASGEVSLSSTPGVQHGDGPEGDKIG